MTASFPLLTTHDEYIQAAPDIQLSSPHTHLLSILLSEEDQHQYNQLLNITLSDHILHILHQLSSLLHLSPSTLWTTMILLKKLILLQHPLELLTVVACVTLSHKYQHSSSHPIDYEYLAYCYYIDNIQLIHDAEVVLLDVFSYDICVTTPDHFFSYISNLVNNDDTLKQTIQQTQSSLSFNSLSPKTLELLFNYPSSVVTLSLLCHHSTSKNFILEQMTSFLLHKKDLSHYATQLLHCINQLQSTTA